MGVDPLNISALNMKRAEILSAALRAGKVSLMHARNKHGEEVDVLVILGDTDGEFGSVVPMAVMLNSIGDLEPPDGTISRPNPNFS